MHIHILSRNQLSPNMSLFLHPLSLSLSLSLSLVSHHNLIIFLIQDTLLSCMCLYAVSHNNSVKRMTIFKVTFKIKSLYQYLLSYQNTVTTFNEEFFRH